MAGAGPRQCSFGQALAITPLQLVRAFAAMANGGKLVQPHIYAADDATAEANVQQVISPELSDTLRELMIHVVDEGPNYAEETKIPGYVVGGKTGTAQIWDSQAGGWLANTYNHTFVGFVGNEHPEAIILVRIHDTIPRVPKKWGMSLEMTSTRTGLRLAGSSPRPSYSDAGGSGAKMPKRPGDPRGPQSGSRALLGLGLDDDRARPLVVQRLPPHRVREHENASTSKKTPTSNQISRLPKIEMNPRSPAMA